MKYRNKNIENADLIEEAEVVGDVVIDALISPRSIISKADAATAIRIVVEQFLDFRQSSAFSPDGDMQLYANYLASMAINALAKINIISAENIELAKEITAEEILVRRSIEKS